MCVASGFVKEDKVRSNSKNIIVEIVRLSKVLTKTNENAGKKKKKKELSVVYLKPNIRLYILITNKIVIASSCLMACLMGCLYLELLMSHFEQSVFVCIRSFQILLQYSLVALLPSLLCYI